MSQSFCGSSHYLIHYLIALLDPHANISNRLIIDLSFVIRHSLHKNSTRGELLHVMTAKQPREFIN